MQYLNKNFLVLLLAIIFCANKTLAQNEFEASAPTLQIGLDELSFSKGNLDAQLIMEIIAEKQEELKIKAIQSIFLKKVQNSGGTIYSFTDNVVRELVFEKDPKVRTKKILENTVNLVFVASYLNYYLSTLDGPSKKNILLLADQFNCKPTKTDKLTLASFVNIQREKIEQINGKSEAEINEETIQFLSILIDLTSEVVKNDEKLKQLGLMQISYSSTYDYMNKFSKLKKEKIELKEGVQNTNHFLYRSNSKLKTADIKSIQTISNQIYSNTSTHLSGITNYIGLINFFVTEYSYRNDNLELFNDQLLNQISITNYSDEINNLNKLKTEIETIIKSLTTQSLTDEKLILELKNLNKIYFYVDKAVKAINNKNVNPKTVADIIYTFHNEFKPLLLNQSYRSIKYIDVISNISGISNSLAKLLLKNNNSLRLYNENINPFLLIASKLYEFNEAETISQYLNLIEDIGYIFPDDNVKNALSTVITFVKDYTVISESDSGKEVINFNVESFLVKLQQIRPYKLNRWQFHFTVGTNNAYFQKNLVMNDGSITRNLSYVGEKIGVKFKFWDNSFWMNRNPGETYSIGDSKYVKTTHPKEPLISNIHTLIYGTGLLYNLVNTKSNKVFNMPLIGTGVGITFFNALDLNLTYGVPIFSDSDFGKSFDNSFFNLGFDIQFIEYYKRLREKQKTNKLQKQLIEAK